MRLICPNCGAQYEVDDAVIPDQGRDVQCSNCGHTWFQRPAHLDEELAEELDQDLPSANQTDDEEEAEGGTASETAVLQKRGLDPEVASVLREEAEREAEARRGDTDGLETQPDLGLDDAAEIAANRSAAARARMARLRGLDETSPEAEASGAAASGSRRDLLPDVEEINSTLRASEDREDGEDAEVLSEEELVEKKGRSGSRLVTRLILLVVLFGVLVYVFAPQIIAALPQSEPYLVPYVDWANTLRAQINAGISVALEKSQALIEQYTGSE